jgi:hypothetical protein
MIGQDGKRVSKEGIVSMLRKFRKTLFVATVVVIISVLTFALPVSAIQSGTPDGDNHPYVVICVFDVAGAGGNPVPAWRTTGLLISPTVVVTAGHGTDGAIGARVSTLSNIPPIPRPIPPGYDGYPFPGPWAVEASEINTHPDYRSVSGNGLPQFDSFDVGVIILSTPIILAEYAELPGVNFVDGLAMKTAVDLVGYGVTSQNKGNGVSPGDSWTWDRYRNFAMAKLVQSNDVISGMFLKLTANPGQDKGGTTFGDSGGPILLAGTNIALGVNSFVTNANCDGVTYAQRLDIPAVLDWLTDFLSP